MRRLPSRFRRLDGALVDLPVEEPMLLTELDGFLTGLVIGPEPIAAAEWMTCIWGVDTADVPPFEHPADVQWFAAAVAARRDEIARDLARGRFQPILDIDDRTGEALWEYWIDGFAEAVALRPEAWDAPRDDAGRATAWATLSLLIAVAHDESDLDSVAINALEDRAVGVLIEAVQRLYVAPPEGPVAVAAAAVGRNDPCSCGSGRKHKRCCGG